MPSTHPIKATLNRLTNAIAFMLVISVLLACGPAATPARPTTIVLTPPAPTPTPTTAPTATPTAADRCGQLCDPGFWHTAVPDTVRLQLERNPDLSAPGGRQGGSALNVAAAHTSHPAIIDILLDAGADLEFRSSQMANTPLIAGAALNPNPDVVAALLEQGADIEARNNQGQTPLIVAAALNPNPAVAHLLLEHNADLEAREHLLGATPLHAAVALNPNAEMVELLLEHDADIAALTPNQNTVAHTFAEYSVEPAVGAVLLLKNRDLRDQRNSDGKKPCQITAERSPNTRLNPPFTEHNREQILRILCRYEYHDPDALP